MMMMQGKQPVPRNLEVPHMRVHLVEEVLHEVAARKEPLPDHR